jgi:hypothetical protein
MTTSKVAARGTRPLHEIFGFRTHKPEVNIVVVCDVEEMNARNRAITSFTNASGNPERARRWRLPTRTCRADAVPRNELASMLLVGNVRSGGENHLSRRALYQCRPPSDLLEGNMKNSNEQSLRCQVEKWLAPAPAIPVHVTEFSRTRWGGRRYVCVETSSEDGARALFFFRHDDGNWCVFPPTADRRKLTTVRPVPRVVADASYVLSATRPLPTSPPSSELPINTNA